MKASERNRLRKNQLKSKFFILAIIALVCLIGTACFKAPAERILFDFETDRELDQFHWKCRTLFSLSDAHATHGSKSLKLELYPSEYPGLAPMIKNTDWSHYGALRFDVYNPQSREVSLSVRIDDREDYPDYADRYNSSFVISPGANTVTISFDSFMTSGTKRPLNRKKIYRLLMFLTQPVEKTTLYLDYMRLVRTRQTPYQRRS